MQNTYLFIRALDNRDFDHLSFDSKTQLWHLSKQPNVAPPIYSQLNVLDFCKYFRFSMIDEAYGQDDRARNLKKLKNCGYDLFYFNSRLNSWAAALQKDNYIYMTARSFSDLIEKI